MILASIAAETAISIDFLDSIRILVSLRAPTDGSSALFAHRAGMDAAARCKETLMSVYST
jgi:hypothetical protein